MIKLGITGNIACGKNFVGECLQALGCPTIDSDETVHQILSGNNIYTERLIQLCVPNRITSEDSASFIDRQKLGKLVFANKLLREQVEAILHPAVYEATKSFFEDCEKKGFNTAANLVPLLYEKNLENRYDHVWLVYCEPKIQKERLKIRNPDLSPEDIQQRINAQMDQELKKSKADYVIDNSDSWQVTKTQVELGLKQILTL
jgi:dephospho-CoA kinase